MSKVIPSLINLGASNIYGERQSEDFYATSISTVEKLLPMLLKHNINIKGLAIEPSVGSGNVLNGLMKHYNGDFKYLAFDIIDRGFPNTIVQDWLTVKELPNEQKFIIGNPPYKYALEHIAHGIDLLNDGEYSIQLLKIQFLEGQKRKSFFMKNPPKFVFVFSERQNCYKNNIDLGTSSAICYCWYVWQKGFNGYPTIDWI